MKALFDKLTGGSEEPDYFQDTMRPLHDDSDVDESDDWMDTDQGDVFEEEEEQLAVDVFQDSDHLYIQAYIGALDPSDLDIDITRDSVSLRGKRYNEHVVEDENYFQSELSWGSFSRKILLPREIDIEGVKASAKNGLLTLQLPKIDKDRTVKIQVG